VLRQAERHGQERVEEPEGRTGQGRDQHAGPQPGTEIDRQPAGHGARRKDALDAEIEHARALADEGAEHPEHQGRRDAQGRRPEA
jgi:hypothetical protein